MVSQPPMDQTKNTGFSLFPTPPTPPARRKRAATTSTSSSGNSISSVSSSTRSVRKPPPPARHHVRKSSVSLIEDKPSGLELVPPPLKIRRAVEEVPPLPTSLPTFGPLTPSRIRPHQSTPPKTPDSAPPQLPAIPESSPFAPLPRTPPRQGHRYKPRTVAEHVELEAVTRRRASSRLSQWLDVEDGEVNRQRLSRYLGSVLGGTFEIPNLEALPRDSLAIIRRMSKGGQEPVVKTCECPSDAIICHCSSSPEFEQFRNWTSHKPNSSVSSTACLLGVPRARFQAGFFTNMEPTIAELPSPPGLSYDAADDESENGDWVTPLTPSNRDDVFNSSLHRGKSFSTQYTVPSTPSTGISTPSRFQSFSRPFRPDSSCQGYSDVSSPSTPSRSGSRSTDPKMGFLTSISTMSSFDFDFDIKSRRRSLLERAKSDHQDPSITSGDREHHTHLRTGSNESFVSQGSQTSHYELNTATATVAVSSPGMRPVLVTNTPKRGKILSSRNRSPASGSTSTKSSTSSFSVPEYWHRYNAGTQPRSRSTTVGSNATADSVAFSALLTMPLLNPRTVRPAIAPSPGNSLAEQPPRNVTAPSITQSHELGLFDFGTTATRDTSGLMSGQLNVSLSQRSAYTKPGVSREIENDHDVDDDDDPGITADTDEHMQAYAAVNTRLKAYMASLDAVPDHTTDLYELDGGLGLETVTTTTTDTRNKRLTLTLERHEPPSNDARHDSGVFGRLGAVSLGTNLITTSMPGRRDFSEPQFYRCHNGR